MIINSALSIVFLLSTHRCLLHLKELSIFRNKIMKATILSVAQALKKVDDLPKGQRIFMIVRGLVKLKNRLQGSNSIYSLFQQSSIKMTKLSEYMRRTSWNDIPSKSFWRQPHSLKKLTFQLQDMSQQVCLEVRGVNESAMSSALNQVFKHVQKKQSSTNLITRFFANIYNFIASRPPLAWILSPTTIGEEIALYSIQDGQHSLVLGQFEKDAEGMVFCAFPKFVTKQANYIESKLRKKYNRLCLISFLLILLLSITVIKLARQIFIKIQNWRNRYIANNGSEIEQDRSENEGDNCNCTLCYVNIRNIIFKPCRHYAVCKGCYQQLPLRSTCPFCKKDIEGFIEVVKIK